jgi:hypothetical protein
LSCDPFFSALSSVSEAQSHVQPPVEAQADDFSSLVQRSATNAQSSSALALTPAAAFPAVATLQGFDLQDQPLIANLALCPGQVLTARSALPLRQSMIGRSVVVVFEGGNPQAPIIMGVVEQQPLQPTPPADGLSVQADGERHVITAEREIVLRCGDASITLTRAGKVIIKGHYILSRATGYNKIKGAAIDIN